MLALLLLAPLSPLAPPRVHAPPAPLTAPQEDGDEKKDAEEKARREELEKRAQEAAKTLKAALRSKDPAARRAALMDASEVVHPAVIEAMAKGLRDKDAEVRGQVIALFGSMVHPDALGALRDHARRRRKELEKDPERMVLLLRSIALHGDAAQIPWLIQGAFTEEERQVRRARVLGVSRTRSRAALEAIFETMERHDLRKVRSGFIDTRTALVWITGTDQGEDPHAWARWWRDNEDSFEIPKKAPKLTGKLRDVWRYFWDEDMPAERQKRRGDRG